MNIKANEGITFPKLEDFMSKRGTLREEKQHQKNMSSFSQKKQGGGSLQNNKSDREKARKNIESIYSNNISLTRDGKVKMNLSKQITIGLSKQIESQ
jgi:hypothetical protein